MSPRPLALLLAVAVAGCGRDDGLFAFLSPSEGAVVEVPWVPLLLRSDARILDPHEVKIRLDGEPWVDPLALVSNRYRWWGDGYDWLATLELWDAEAGEHRLQARWEGRRAEARFTLAPPACALTVETVDGAGLPVPARVQIRAPEGWLDFAGPDAELIDLRGRDLPLYTLFTANGSRRIRLPCGPLQVLAARGVREEVAVADVNLVGEEAVRLALPRVVETPGWSAVDLHVHTGRSGDAFLPDRQRFESFRAAALDAVVLTDHNLVADGSAAVAATGGEELRAISGVEVTMSALKDNGDRISEGHFNAFPVAPGATLPERVVREPAAQIDAIRANPDTAAALLQLNHPRGIQFDPAEPPSLATHAVLTRRGWERGAPVPTEGVLVTPDPVTGTTALDWEALEVVNRFSWPLYLHVRSDWYALWRAGWTLTGTGNSDSHAIEVETAGFPVNFVACSPPVEEGCLVEAVRAGRLGVSNGPVLELRVRRGADEAAPGGLLAGTGEVEVEARVRAASWVPVPELRVVVDGEVVHRVDLSGAPRTNGLLDQRQVWRFTPAADAFVVVEAGWPLEAPTPEPAALGTYALVAPGHLPLAFTNPVRVDADGDGLWRE